MSKIEFDKYYTPIDLARYVVDKTKEVIGIDNISEYLEPSAGAGVFLDFLEKDYLAFDIEPEDDRIVKQDYLTLYLPYKRNRCIIGNPPYGIKNTLAVQFYKKSIQMCDYISFILPSSQYNNNNQLYEFDLVHSELIDNMGFIDLDKRINLSLNIYKRNPNGLNEKPNYKLKDVVIKEARKGVKNSVTNDYDIGICSFGWSLGKQPEYVGQYANEFYLYIKNEKYKSKIIELIKSTNWKDVVQHMTGIEKINQWQVYKYIKEQIPEIN
jgi:hypothetical protein